MVANVPPARNSIPLVSLPATTPTMPTPGNVSPPETKFADPVDFRKPETTSLEEYEVTTFVKTSFK